MDMLLNDMNGLNRSEKLCKKDFNFITTGGLNTCPDYAERKFLAISEDLIVDKSRIDHLNIVGYSYGGTLVAGLADETPLSL